MPPQHTDSRRPHHFVAGEGKQISTDPSTVMGSCGTHLGCVHDDDRADRMCEGGDPADRVDRAQHIGHIGHRDDLGSFVQQTVPGRGVEVEPTSSVMSNQRSVAPVRSASSCQGTRLEWCSITDTTISSPGLRRAPNV